jgi:hypothetical protein
MLGEDVEMERRDQRVAQRVLLVEEARMRARIAGVPGAPFVDRSQMRFSGSYLSMIALCLVISSSICTAPASVVRPFVLVEIGGEWPFGQPPGTV